MSAGEVLVGASTQPVSPRGRFFTNQTFHFETLRNAGYIFSQSADLGEILETVIAAGHSILTNVYQDPACRSWCANLSTSPSACAYFYLYS